MPDKKPYISKRIYNELCNKCHGTGLIRDPLNKIELKPCDTCEGTGKVRITKEISLLIEPLK